MSSNIVLSSLNVSQDLLGFYPPLKSCSCFRREVGRVEIQLPVQQPTSPVHSLLPPDPTAVPRGLPSSSLPRTSCWAPQLAPPPGSSGSPSPAMSPRLCLLLPTVSFIYFYSGKSDVGRKNSSMNWDESWLTWSPWPCPLMSIEKKCRFSFWELFCGLSNHANEDNGHFAKLFFDELLHWNNSICGIFEANKD